MPMPDSQWNLYLTVNMKNIFVSLDLEEKILATTTCFPAVEMRHWKELVLNCSLCLYIIIQSDMCVLQSWGGVSLELRTKKLN